MEGFMFKILSKYTGRSGLGNKIRSETVKYDTE